MSTVVAQALDLTRHYKVSRGMFDQPATVKALNGVSFSLEAGKTLADAIAEIREAVDFLTYYAGEIERLDLERPASGRRRRSNRLGNSQAPGPWGRGNAGERMHRHPADGESSPM